MFILGCRAGAIGCGLYTAGADGFGLEGNDIIERAKVGFVACCNAVNRETCRFARLQTKGSFIFNIAAHEIRNKSSFCRISYTSAISLSPPSD